MSTALSINPTTGKQIGTYERIAAATAKAKLAAARKAFQPWKKLPLKSGLFASTSLQLF